MGGASGAGVMDGGVVVVVFTPRTPAGVSAGVRLRQRRRKKRKGSAESQRVSNYETFPSKARETRREHGV